MQERLDPSGTASGPLASGPRATISVALCTYNGERYLPEQLASIRAQSRLPDEVVICDDGSSDSTLDLLRSFAASSPFRVRVQQNSVRLGSTKNFEQAIRLCTGSLIALSDQDDIWSPARLARSEEALFADASAGLLFSNAEIIDGTGNPTGTRLWQAFGFGGALKQRFDVGDMRVFARYRFVTGATVMFRAEIRDLFLPIAPSWTHDAWIAAVLACTSRIVALDEPLIQYRQHASQQLGLARSRWRHYTDLTRLGQQHWQTLAGECAQFRELSDFVSAGALSGSPLGGAVRLRMLHLCRRANLPRHRPARIGTVASEWASYRREGVGLLSAAKDLLLAKP